MFSVSIVVYNHSVSDIEPLVNTLTQSKGLNDIYIVDNSHTINVGFQKLPVTYIFNDKNVGYGAGHNIAIRKTIKNNISYHLVLNPDVCFDSIVLDELISYMNENENIGHLMPKVFYPNGEVQYLCKLLPTPQDLLIRRFLPQNWFYKAKSKYELRDTGYDKIMQVPCLSGCFMLLRIDALKEVGLFDERFFMYPEDIDLTRRIHQKYKTVFYPKVSIVHQHTKASYKSTKLLFIHMINIIKYFNKWGWFFDKERKKVNKETLKMLNLL